MSGNKFQIKRTGIAGRQPNTSNSSNSSYIDVGELALNFTDGILYSSNGTVLLELGANVTNQNITGTLTANSSVGNDGDVLISNGSGVYWDTPKVQTLAVGQRNSEDVEIGFFKLLPVHTRNDVVNINI